MYVVVVFYGIRDQSARVKQQIDSPDGFRDVVPPHYDVKFFVRSGRQISRFGQSTGIRDRGQCIPVAVVAVDDEGTAGFAAHCVHAAADDPAVECLR